MVVPLNKTMSILREKKAFEKKMGQLCLVRVVSRLTKRSSKWTSMGKSIRSFNRELRIPSSMAFLAYTFSVGLYVMWHFKCTHSESFLIKLLSGSSQFSSQLGLVFCTSMSYFTLPNLGKNPAKLV